MKSAEEYHISGIKVIKLIGERTPLTTDTG